MADNVSITTGSDATIATDDVGGIQYQRVKVDLGGDGSASPLVRGQQSAANSLPVTLPSDQGALAVTDNGGSLTVDVGTALPAGDNVIGRVKISDGTDVADVLDLTNSNPIAVAIVDTNGDQIASFGGGTQYTEDAAAAANPVGTATILVRADSLAGVTSADGDNVAARGTDKGELYVKHVDAIPVTDNGGSITVDGTVTATGVAGAAAHDAAVSGNPVLAAGYASAAAPSDVSGDGDAVRAWHLRNGAAATVITAAGALVGGDATNGLDVDVTRLPALPAGTNNIGDVDVLSLPALPAGSNAIGKLAANSGVDIGDVDVTSVNGQSAHDAAIAGAPVRVGARALSADLTAVTTGDTTDLIADLVGKLVVMPYALNQNFVSGVTAAITGTSDTSVIAAAGAGIRNYVTSLTVTNSHATVGTVVEIKDGTTVIWRGYAAPAGGGFTLSFPVPLRGTANTAINAANITTGSNTYVSAAGYKAP